MKAIFFRTAAAVALAAAMTSGAVAKTMTYCSEGSPENFNPQINTTGPSLSAAHPVFNRLVEFERDSTKLKPGLAESWDISSEIGRAHV